MCLSLCFYSGKGEIQKKLLELELEAVGIRLNKRRPNIYFKVHIMSLIHCSNYTLTITVYIYTLGGCALLVSRVH